MRHIFSVMAVKKKQRELPQRNRKVTFFHKSGLPIDRQKTFG